VDATIPQFELMESAHNMRVGVRDTQAVACLMINSRHTAGGRARKLIVYDALVHQIFIARRYASAVYILCDSPVSVRPCVWLGAEGLSDAKSCRDPRRDVIVHAAYYYRRAAVAWSVHPPGLLLLGLWSNNRVANVQT